MLARSIDLAARVHVNQVDKGGIPYILHPLRLMSRLPKAHPDIKDNPYARLVKIEGVCDNYDIIRLKGMLEKDLERMEKYKLWYIWLTDKISKYMFNRRMVALLG